MKNLILLLFLSSLSFGWSQTKVKSFYFPFSQKEPTLYSQEQLAKLKYSAQNGSVKILEINAFTDSVGSASFNDTLALQRLKYVSQRLPINESVVLNAYALQRPYQIDAILNWRRVDVVYEIIPEQKEELSADATNDVTNPNDTSVQEEDLSHLADDPEVATEQKETFASSLREMTPLVLDITFKEGTSKILESSYSEITKLVVFLKENPTVKAEIRGHVCCGNNMRISQSRAKSVYRRLVKQGVSKDRLAYRGMSNKEPLVFPETTNADRQKNRRVDVKLYK